MNLLQKLPKKLKRFFLGGAIACVGLCLTLVLGVLLPRLASYPAEPCSVQIYLEGDNLHTNLVLPIKDADVDWLDWLNLPDEISRTEGYLSFGWGDRTFYVDTPTWDDLELTSALRSLFWFNNPSVMHVRYYRRLPKSNHPYQVWKLDLGQAGYQRLIAFIQQSFQVDQQNSLVYLQPGHSTNSYFYKATGSYSAFNTCNSWIAEGLHRANVSTPLWGGLAIAIWRHAQSQCLAVIHSKFKIQNFWSRVPFNSQQVQALHVQALGLGQLEIDG